MKKILSAAAVLICGLCFALAETLSSAEIETGEVYVCARSRQHAETAARVIIGTYDMQRASFCKCEQVPPYNKEKVRKGKWAKQDFEYEYGKCEPPQDKVFRCFCVGKNPVNFK